MLKRKIERSLEGAGVSKKGTSANKGGEGEGRSKNHPIYANVIIEWSRGVFLFPGPSPGPGPQTLPQYIFDGPGRNLYLAVLVLNLHLSAFSPQFVFYRPWLVREGNNKGQRLHIKLIFLFSLSNSFVTAIGYCSLLLFVSQVAVRYQFIIISSW